METILAVFQSCGNEAQPTNAKTLTYSRYIISVYNKTMIEQKLTDFKSKQMKIRKDGIETKNSF